MSSTLGLRDHLTHRGNLRSSRYGWLRLTPMYSVHLVEELLARDLERLDGPVLDPFCGTGTTALVCAERGIPCDTLDINPFLLWLTETKTQPYTEEDVEMARELSDRIATAMRDRARGRAWVPDLRNIDKWWQPDVLGALSRAWQEIQSVEPSGARALLTVAFLRTVIRTAHVSFNHQSMSFKREGERPPASDDLSPATVEWANALHAIADAAGSPIAERPNARLADARDLTSVVGTDRYASVITSPPYCNRMSYIRELRPYMYWLGYLQDGRSAGELDWKAIGGTWGIATSNLSRWEPDDRSVVVPFDGFTAMAEQIGSSSAVLGRYVAKYFYDTVLHAREVARAVLPGGCVHYVIGNSKFYDVMVPAEAIYAAILGDVGFTDISCTVIRKRTSKRELYEYLVSARKPD
jgi:hypothetical protein